MQRRTLVQFAATSLPLMLVPGVARPQVLDINDAINKAGRQRMLSQRLAKSYMAMGQKVEAASAERILVASMALFDRQSVELKAFAPNLEIKSTYAQLEARWADYKGALIGSAPSKSVADGVLSLAAQVLQLANQGTLQLEAFSGKTSAKMVNIAGRQRMLSQRMAAYYLSASWGVLAGPAATEMAKAREEFAQAHAVLKSAPQANAAILSELQLAESQFSFFEGALKTLKPGAADAQAQANVFTTSERILQIMDGVTVMFTKLG